MKIISIPKAIKGLALLCLFGSIGTAGAQVPLTLFNGNSLLGWNTRGSWSPSGGVLASTGSSSRGITTAVPFADFTLVFDYNESTMMGAKLRLWAPHSGEGGTAIDLDSSGQAAGLGGVEGSTVSHVAGIADGSWHHVTVEANAGRVSVHVDGSNAGTASLSGAHTGYLSWEVSGQGTFQIRNIKLSLSGLTPAFNGTDLSSWKTVAHGPASKGGVGHDATKMLTLGFGGGSTKPHSAKWTVMNGAIHGEDGPGGLEYASPVDDAIVQISAGIRGEAKPDHFTSIGLRTPTGQLEGGYEVGIGPFSGSIQNLAKHAVYKVNGSVEETIIIAGRTIAVWVAGALVNVNTDPRPDSAKTAQGAKTTSGTMTLELPGDGVQLNVQRLSYTALAMNYGVAAAPPPPVASTAVVAAPAAPQGPSATETAMLRQQQTAAQQADTDRQSKQHVASLMAQALGTQDPAQQMSLYNQVVQIDPSNAPAVQGYKDAQTKLQATQDAQTKAATAVVTEQQNSQTRDQQVNGSLVKAQAAFLAGHLTEASSALSVAERLAPDNPLVRDLRSRISATSSLHSRVLFLTGGAGLIGLLAIGALWFRRRNQQKFPMLEITRGLDSGQQYSIDKDVTRIGAVAQDGGQKNDIVVRDVEHAISRFHCELMKQNGQIYVRDMQSSNGTKLEGVPLIAGKPEWVRKGNRILLADTVELRFGFGRKSTTPAKSAF